MSSRLRRLPRPRGRLAIATGGVVLAGAGVGIGVGLHAHADAVHQAQVNKTLDALGLSSNGVPRGATTAAPGGGAGAGGSAQGGAAAGAAAASSASSSGAAKPGSGGASPTPYAVPTPYDAIQASPNVRTSNCQGYPRNVDCKVNVSGAFYLKSQPAGQVVIQVLIDHNVVSSHTIQAPNGGYRFTWTMEFTVPSGSHEVDYQALLESTQGSVLAKSVPYVTYAN